MKIQTSKLQELLAKSIKGVGNNKLFIATQYITIKCNEEGITLLSTDGNNYLYITENMQCEEFTTTVKADTFCGLINKMTCDEIEMTMADDVLNVKGNGKYQIGTLNEAGVTEIFNPFIDIDFKDTKEIDNKEFKQNLNIGKPSLALSLEQPCYTGYYIGDKMVTTDTFQITSIDKKVFDEDVLMYSSTADLLNLINDDTISVSIHDGALKFVGENIELYTKELSGKEDYQMDSIINLTNIDFHNRCVLNKEVLINALSRLELFVDFFDKNALNMHFDKNSLTLTTKGTNGKEVIPFVSSEIKDEEYDCIIDIKLLQAQLNVVNADEIDLYYHDNNNTAIKIVNDNVVQFIALMAE